MPTLVLYIILLGLLGMPVLCAALFNRASKKREEKERAERERRAMEQQARERRKEALRLTILSAIGLPNTFEYLDYYHKTVVVRSHQALDNYNATKFVQANPRLLDYMEKTIKKEDVIREQIKSYFKTPNEHEKKYDYEDIKAPLMKCATTYSGCFRVYVKYVTPSGNTTHTKLLLITLSEIANFKKNPQLYMTKAEYTQYLQQSFDATQQTLYNRINAVIDKANETKQALIQKSKAKMLDDAVSELYKNAVSNLQKLKSANTATVDIISKAITTCEHEVQTIAEENDKLLKYYRSKDFLSIRTACNTLMQSQLEFNQYIEEKSNSLASLLGGTVLREETVHDDGKNYIRPYVKDVTPFTAEVSAAVFASAENDPMKYIVKHFYADKARLPQQLQKLYTLVEELETLNEARAIIEKKKQECAQYLNNVPAYVMNQDSSGFYTRLGFANIDEKILNLEYKFQYTSDGGYAQKSFIVKITEEFIIQLIGILENKLTYEAFTKEQRAMMTSKLREEIKERDNHTCCKCGNSTYNEPNLLLEIDHILPVSKGGLTKPDNLQTLCWRCNRSKGNKT